MRKNLVWNVALSAALLLGTSAAAVAQSNNDKDQGKSQQSAATADQENGKQMYLVMPGVEQTITGADRQEVQIAKEARHELAMLPYYTIFDDLEYRVDGTTVTLGGKVISVGLKRDAESAVKGVEGVTKVINNIQDLSPSPADQRIRYEEARKIFSFGNLSRYGWEASPTIHIVVDGGHVTLKGIVDNEADKNAAGIMANQVTGVFSVKNDLQVVPPSKKK